MAQKKKKKKGLLIALLILVLLVALYAVVRLYGGGDETDETEAETEETITMLELDTDTIQSFTYNYEGETLTFSLEDEVWYYEGDKDFPVEQSSITTMLSNLSSVTATRQLTDITDLGEYGLESPQKTISLTDENGTESTLYIGDLNNNTSEYYASVGEEGTIYTIGSTIPTAFEKALYDLVDAEDFEAIDSTTVYQLTVEQEDYQLVLNKDTTASTYTVSANGGEEEDADSDTATTFLTEIDNLAFASCVNYNAEDLSQYGLENPAATITIKYTETYEIQEETEELSTDTTTETETEEETETKTITVNQEETLYVGDYDEEGEFYYVKMEGSTQVHTMKASLLETLLQESAEQLYSTYICYYIITEVERMQISYQGTDYELYSETVEVDPETDEDAETADETAEETEAETEEIFYINGEQVSESLYRNFYGLAATMTAEGYLEDDAELEGDPEFAITFKLLDGTSTKLVYYAYDSSFYAVETSKGIVLVNKMSYLSMTTAFDNLLSGEEETEAVTE